MRRAVLTAIWPVFISCVVEEHRGEHPADPAALDQGGRLVGFGVVGGGTDECDGNGVMDPAEFEVCENGAAPGCIEVDVPGPGWECSIQQGWACLNPGINDPPAASICHEIVCGDGNPDVGPNPLDPIEDCDDGNIASNDGFRSN